MQVNSSNGSLQQRFFSGTGSIGGIHLPDFNEEDLHKAIASYQNRQRRFGKTEAQVEEEEK